MIDFSSAPAPASASSFPQPPLSTPSGQGPAPAATGTPVVVVVDVNINITVASSASPVLANLPTARDASCESGDFSPPPIARTSARAPEPWRDLSLRASLHGPNGHPMRHALRDPDLLRVLWGVKTLPRPDRDPSQERTAP